MYSVQSERNQTVRNLCPGNNTTGTKEAIWILNFTWLSIFLRNLENPELKYFENQWLMRFDKNVSSWSNEELFFIKLCAILFKNRKG